MKKRNQSFLFLLFFCASFCFAQDTQDSLSYYSAIALHPKESRELINASKYFSQQLEASKDTEDLHTQLNSLYYIASINYKIGSYDESEKAAVVAVEILDSDAEINNKEAYRRSFYNLLGVVYADQHNYSKAVELYERVLKVAANTRDSAIAYNNIANVYKRNNLIQESHEASTKSFRLTPKLKDTLTVALILNNLGYIKTRIKDYKLGRLLMFEALKLRNITQDSTAQFSSYSNLAKYYIATDSINKAKFYANKALDYANRLKSASYRQKALGLLVELSTDDYAKAYKHLNDSLEIEDKVRDNKYALMRYDYSEFERLALESQLKAQRQKSKAIIFAVVAFGVGVISILVFFYLRIKHKKEKLKEILYTESRISKQVHDEVANNVFQVMTKFENGTHEHGVLADDLYQLYHKARDISNQLGSVDTAISFTETLEILFEGYESEEINIVIKGLADMNWDKFSAVQKNIIYKVLQELLINMKKYSQASLVLIRFETDGKRLKIMYSDNGEGAVLVKHTGLLNTENRIHYIGGTITFETEPQKGFKAKIVI
ncbi:MAG: hypothetical protein Tsb0033_19080 [Winogradskyella sp.]